jgi:hypothetical protein
VFWRTQRYGMVHDFLGWLMKYSEGSWSDVWNGFGYFGLHPVFHIINYGTFRLFGHNQLAWCIVFAVLHGLTAFLLFSFLNKVCTRFNINHGIWIAFFSSVGFLLGPYQTEVVTWKACMHYLLTTMFFLSGMILFVRYMWEQDKKIYLIAHHLLFIAALLTLEVNLATPFIILAFSVACSKLDNWDWRKYLSRFFVIHIIIIILYFLANKLILGEWVGHYGAEKHLNFNPQLLAANGFRYFTKYTLLTHFWSFNLRGIVYENIGSWYAIGGLFALVGSILVFARKKIYNNNKLLLSASFLVMFFMALFPIVNLYFMYIMPFQNDRYGFFASIFFYPFLFLLVFSLPRLLRFVVAIAILTVHIYYGLLNVQKCHEAGQLIDNLITSYKWHDQPEVRLLSLPDNYQGLFLYADYHDGSAETFVEALNLFGSEEITGHIDEYSHFNQVTLKDSFKYQVIQDTFTVEFKQYGNWFWRNNIGFINYETDEVKATRARNILRVELKDTTDRIYLIPQGGEWNQVYLE